MPVEAVKPGRGCEAHMYHCCPPGPRIESQHNDDSDSIREICPSTGSPPGLLAATSKLERVMLLADM